MANEQKQTAARHLINFTNPNDVEVVCLAQLGWSNKAIRNHVPQLTDCQINYRCTKAKVAEGLPKGEGYRTQWRQGTSPIAQRVADSLLPNLRREAFRQLPPRFAPKRPAQVVEQRR